jgi:hypothetical protein
MENNIQTLENEVKSLTKIVNLLSEDLKYIDTTKEVRKADCTYADKLKSNNTLSCNCDRIKSQLIVAQSELKSVKTIIDIISKEIKYIKQRNSFPSVRCSSTKSCN